MDGTLNRRSVGKGRCGAGFREKPEAHQMMPSARLFREAAAFVDL